MATQTPTTATAPLGSTARTNQLLAEGAKQGLGAAPTFNIDSPATVAANVSKGLSTPANPGGNPLDAPGAVPVAQPGKNLDGSPLGSKQATTPNATQPSPQNPTAPANTQTPGQATQLGPNDQVPQGLADQVGQVQSAADQIAQSHKQALADLTKSGVTPPSSQGSGHTGVQIALNTQPQPELPTPAAVTSFLDPAANPLVDTQMAQLREFLSPAADRQALTDALSQLTTDKSSLAGLKTELMNVKRIMAGSQQDIMDEVTKAGGTISASLLSNMTIARNRALVTQGQNLQDQIQTAQDAVATDTTLVGEEKQLAAQQFTQNMSLLQFQQTNYNNQMNAARQSIDTLIKTPGGLASYAADPVQAARAEKVMGFAPGTIVQMNIAAQQAMSLDTQVKQANIEQSKASTAASYASAAKSRAEIAALNSPDVSINPDGTPVDPNNHSILAQTGLSLPAFYTLTGQTSNLPKDKATRAKAFSEAQSWANGKGIDISTIQSQYKAQNDVLQKNIERAANTKVFAGEVEGSVDALINVIDQKDLSGGVMGGVFGIGSFKPSNLVSLATGKQVNDKLTQKYSTQLHAMVNDYAGYLAASRGASTPELADIQSASEVVSNGLNKGSAQAFKEAVQANEEKVSAVVDRAVSDARRSVWDLFGVGDKFKGNNTPTVTPKLLPPTDIPPGYYQASDGLLYKK